LKTVLLEQIVKHKQNPVVLFARNWVLPETIKIHR